MWLAGGPMPDVSVIHRLFKSSETEYANDRYRQLLVNYENFFLDDGKRIDFDKPLLPQIQRISFELSNICNYSFCHKKCPASKVTMRKTLPTFVVRKILMELATIGYSGAIAFHRYNEPLIDPRLFSLIQLVKETCPQSKILVLTNGFYLTQQMADDLGDLDIWVLAVSAYSKSEFSRLSKIQTSLPYKVFYSVLDNREDIYTSRPLDLNAACLAPLRDLTINVDGNVCLCCMDWQNRHEFGDVSHQTLTEIINSSSCLEVAKELNRSVRRLDICRRCQMSR